MIHISYSPYYSIVSSSNDACDNNDAAQPQEIFLYSLAPNALFTTSCCRCIFFIQLINSPYFFFLIFILIK